MASEFLLTNNTISNIILNSLDGFTLLSTDVDINMFDDVNGDFSETDVFNNEELQSLIDATDITAKDEIGNVYSNLRIKPTFPIRNIGTILIPPVLSIDQDDYNPIGLSSADALYLESSSNVELTGIKAQPDGTVLNIVVLNGSDEIKFKRYNNGSQASNRFRFEGDITLKNRHGMTMVYVGSDSSWYCISVNVV